MKRGCGCCRWIRFQENLRSTIRSAIPQTIGPVSASSARTGRTAGPDAASRTEASSFTDPPNIDSYGYADVGVRACVGVVHRSLSVDDGVCVLEVGHVREGGSVHALFPRASVPRRLHGRLGAEHCHRLPQTISL